MFVKRLHAKPHVIWLMLERLGICLLAAGFGFVPAAYRRRTSMNIVYLRAQSIGALLLKAEVVKLGLPCSRTAQGAGYLEGGWLL